MFPGHVFRDMVVTIMHDNMPLMTTEELRARLRAYDPANMQDFAFDGDLLGKLQVRLFEEKVLGGNLWTALHSGMQEFFMHIVPFNAGVYLANPIAALNQEQIVVSAADIVAVQASRQQTRPEQLQGVVVETTSGVPVKGESVEAESKHYFAYPPMRTEDGAVAVDISEADTLNFKGGFYHWWKAPAWIDGRINFNSTAKLVTTTGRGARLKTAVKSSEDEVAYRNTLGPLLAKMIYAQLMNDSMQIPEIVLPFRTDLMPGTTIKMLNGTTVLSGLGFSGRDWYGMLTAVRFDMSNEGEPMLQTVIQTSYVRPTQTLPGTQELGYTDGSFFEGAWCGIDLSGNAITEPPDSREFPGQPKVGLK